MKRLSVLPAGMVLVGEVSGDEDFVVFGTVEGNMNIDGGLTIEEGGTVRGEVNARSITVRGVLVGNAQGLESVVVDAGARMLGDAIAPRVRVIDGARLRGKVQMADAPPRGDKEPSARTAPRREVKMRATDDTLPGATPPIAPLPVLPSLRRTRGKRKHLAH